MRRLLKLCIVAVVLVLGVSSCLKHDDVVNVAFGGQYLLQTEDDKFIPQMPVQSNELKSASLSVDGEKFNFKSLTSPSFLWELPSSSSFGIGLDSVSSAIKTLTVVAVNEKVETYQIYFSAATKKIGEIGVDTLEYNSDDYTVYIKLSDTVKNAEKYYLMIKDPIGEEPSISYRMWIPWYSFEVDALSKKISLKDLQRNFFKDATYKFAVGAGYGSVIKVSRYISATIK